MTTSIANLDVTQYVKVNTGFNAVILQCLRDSVRIAFSEVKPAKDNTAHHMLSGKDQPLTLPFTDSDIWVLALTDTASLIITQIDDVLALEKQAIGDLYNDAYGIPKVSRPDSLFHGVFTFDIPPSAWFSYENGVQVYTSSTITSIGGIADLTTTATETALLMESRECPRYQPNRGHLFSTSIICKLKTADAVRQWGVGLQGENGVGFRLKSDGLLYAVLLSNGVLVLDELIDTSMVTGFDVEKNNLYDIQYQWRSAGNYKFFIGDPGTGQARLVHTFNLLGTLDGASIQNPALPAHFYCERITEDTTLKVGCVDITSENGHTDREVYNSSYAEGVSVTLNDPVIVIHQPDLIDGHTNTRSITFARVTVKCSKKANFKVWTTRDPTAIVGATLLPFKTGSFIETDSTDMVAGAVRATSVDLTKFVFITSIPVEALTREFVDNPYRDRIEFPIVRGDYIVVTASAASGSADCVMEWGEQV